MVVADHSMWLDNVLAIAGAARGDRFSPSDRFDIADGYRLNASRQTLGTPDVDRLAWIADRRFWGV
jgi:hypothetical protein